MFVNAIMYYKVRDATLAVSRVDDYGASARLLSATTLRNVLGTKSLEVGNIINKIKDSEECYSGYPVGQRSYSQGDAGLAS